MGRVSYLKSVHLSGFKSIKSLNIDFLSGLNVVIGKNASGKTNFLTFLNKVMNLSTDDLMNFNSRIVIESKESFEVSISRYIEKSNITNGVIDNIPINSKLKLFTGEERNFSDLDDLKDAIGKESIRFRSLLIRHGYPAEYPLVSKGLGFSVDKNTGLSVELLQMGFKNDFPHFNKVFVGYIFSELFEPMGNRKNVVESKELVQSAINSANSVLEEVRKNLNLYSPIEDIRIANLYSINEVGDKFQVSNLNLEFKVQENWYSFESLSDGTKRLFYIISELTCVNNRNLHFPFQNEDEIRTVLLEEPELGVHPHQLMSLVKFIKNKSESVQIIVTTHSPIVLDVLSVDEIDRVYISTINEHETTFRKLNEKEILKAKKYFEQDMYLSDYWKYSNLEI